MIFGGSNDERQTNATTSFVPTSVSLILLLPPKICTRIMVNYKCSDTIEQSVISGGNNDERLTDVDTHDCYICKVAQYLASHEALLRPFMYALILI